MPGRQDGPVGAGRIEDGTIRVSSMPWDQRIIYVTDPMLKRLQAAAASDGTKPEKLGG